jgi:hypothetical protein
VDGGAQGSIHKDGLVYLGARPPEQTKLERYSVPGAATTLACDWAWPLLLLLALLLMSLCLDDESDSR